MATLQELLTRLVDHEDLTADETKAVMDSILTESASPIAIAAFLGALRVKRETADEVAGLVAAMLTHAEPLKVKGRTVDVVGTGGDGFHTVNISTMAAIVVAGAGLKVVKHGNRGATSKTGSADVLAALGVRLDIPPARVGEIADETGIAFAFAQTFHPAMRHAMPIRREIGVPTTFNILGPLANPAQPAASAIGCSSLRVSPVMAGVLAKQQREGLVFHGDDGMDELAATGPATVWEVRDGEVVEVRIDPQADLGFDAITVEQLVGGEADENAAVVRDVLGGAQGAVRETVVLNAAAGLVADGTVPGTGSGPLVARMAAACVVAAQAIDSGASAEVLDKLVAASQT